MLVGTLQKENNNIIILCCLSPHCNTNNSTNVFVTQFSGHVNHPPPEYLNSLFQFPEDPKEQMKRMEEVIETLKDRKASQETAERERKTERESDREKESLRVIAHC